MNRFVYFLLSLSLLLALFVSVEAVPAPRHHKHTKGTSHKGTSHKGTSHKGASHTGTYGQGTSGKGSTSSSDIKAYLAAHNKFRGYHSAHPLKWNSTLAAAAQKEVDRCIFKHSGGAFGPRFGNHAENLAAGTGNFKIADGIRGWTNELRHYNPQNPMPSHFTQVVWKGSQQVGCAVQDCHGIFDPKYGVAKFYACEYWPQGNILGFFPENVIVKKP